MLTPEELDLLPKNVTSLYAELEEKIISDMARRIVKTDMATETAVWQIKRLEAIGGCQDDIFSRLSKKTNKSKNELKKMFNEAVTKTYGSEAAVYEEAGQSPLPLKDNNQLQRIINAGLKKTNNLFENLTRTTAKTATGQFERVLGTAYMQITSGAFDYNTAIRNAIKELAKGIDSIKYPSGHTDKLDVAVRRASLTGVSQTCGRMSEAIADEMDCDLVLVSAHFGARPEHAVWQGKVFSRSGDSEKYPDFVKSTGYGTGAGLKGWNCRHDFGAFIDGVSINPYTPERLEEMKKRTVEYNGEVMSEYDASQKQRAMERGIRKTKRELAGYDGAINATDDPKLKEALQVDFDRKSVLLKKQEAKLKDFTDKTILRRDRAREQVPAHFDTKLGKAVAFNKSVSQKAIHKAKTHYQKWITEIGAKDSAPKTLAEYYKNKYNDTWEHHLLMGYNKAVKKGDVSPLVGFAKYIETAEQANNSLIGLKLANGYTVKSYTTHFIDRVIGQTSTNESGKRLGVPINSVKSCLLHPLKISDIYERECIINGNKFMDKRIEFFSNDCSIAYSITDNKIIQVSPL